MAQSLSQLLQYLRPEDINLYGKGDEFSSARAKQVIAQGGINTATGEKLTEADLLPYIKMDQNTGTERYFGGPRLSILSGDPYKLTAKDLDTTVDPKWDDAAKIKFMESGESPELAQYWKLAKNWDGKQMGDPSQGSFDSTPSYYNQQGRWLAEVLASPNEKYARGAISQFNADPHAQRMHVGGGAFGSLVELGLGALTGVAGAEFAGGLAGGASAGAAEGATVLSPGVSAIESAAPGSITKGLTAADLAGSPFEAASATSGFTRTAIDASSSDSPIGGKAMPPGVTPGTGVEAIESAAPNSIARGITAADFIGTPFAPAALGNAKAAFDVFKTSATILSPIMALAKAVGGMNAANASAQSAAAAASGGAPAGPRVAAPVTMPILGDSNTIAAINSDMQRTSSRKGRASTILTDKLGA